MIEHHPESELTLSYQARISPKTGLLNLQADYERARELWLGQAATHAQNARVLANAAEFVQQTDPFTAEEVLRRARRLEPANPEWTERLARLYARATWPSDTVDRPRMDPSFVIHVKNELNTSNDVVLVEMMRDLGQAAGSHPWALPIPNKEQQELSRMLRSRGWGCISHRLGRSRLANAFFI